MGEARGYLSLPQPTDGQLDENRPTTDLNKASTIDRAGRQQLDQTDVGGARIALRGWRGAIICRTAIRSATSRLGVSVQRRMQARPRHQTAGDDNRRRQ